MQAQLHKYKAQWIKVDAASVLAYPVLAVSLMTMAGMLAKNSGLLGGWYYAPYAAIVGLISNRVCLRAGLITALLSAVSHEYVFAGKSMGFDWPATEQLLGYLSTIPLAVAVGRRVDWIPPPPQPTDAVSEPMPFTQSDRNRADKPRSYWAVEPSGAWSDDVDVGVAYGRIYVDRLRRSAAPPMSWVIRDMIKAGRWTGVEAGFASTIAGAASLRSDADDKPNYPHLG